MRREEGSEDLAKHGQRDRTLSANRSGRPNKAARSGNSSFR